ncbi:MAG: hypothetical protein Q8S22_00015 [Eubacteriales bacterium]|jgi:hypothetical protein|nr:hypothetical protein [Eubacteriales bacterium]
MIDRFIYTQQKFIIARLVRFHPPESPQETAKTRGAAAFFRLRVAVVLAV